MKRLVTVALVLVTVLGLSVGAAGTGDAAPSTITPGRYQAEYVASGVVPMPKANARIIGRTYYMDYYGTGAWNTYRLPLTPTRNGMVASYARDSASKWFYRIEFVKKRYGYKGIVYNWGGIPIADMILRKRR